jgi:hypothetical protein
MQTKIHFYLLLITSNACIATGAFIPLNLLALLKATTQEKTHEKPACELPELGKKFDQIDFETLPQSFTDSFKKEKSAPKKAIQPSQSPNSIATNLCGETIKLRRQKLIANAKKS